jgi:hypothetical protein
MSETLRTIFAGVLDRLQFQATTHLPSLIAAGVILLGAYLMAVIVRSLFYRIFKGATIDRFMRQTGLAFMFDPSGRLRATRVVAETAYWSVIAVGILTGLSVFGTDLTTRLIEGFVLLIPKLVVAGAILLVGAWLSQYLARCMLVWAFNEGLPYPRRLASAVRLIVFFVAIVVAADHLDFARNVFLAAFIMIMGGFILAVSLAVGLGKWGEVHRYFESKPESHETKSDAVRSLWNQL